MKIINPATEQVIDEAHEDSPSQVEQKFEWARLAQLTWQERPLHERISLISKFNSLLRQRQEELARILSQEMGKPIAQARNELRATPDRIDFFLANVEATLKGTTVLSSQEMVEHLGYEPLGVIANISAWNYPYFVGSNVFIPALLTGNTVLYKPSEFATLTGLAIGKLMKEAGVPEDVFVPVIGAGPTGSALLEQPLNGVFFTGSYATGAKIAHVCGPKMIKLQLELGGKDPTYVCDDVAIEKAAPSLADGAFYNTGQSCCSVERIYVHSKVFDAFVNAFVKEVRGFVIGDPSDEKTYIGPLTRPAQLEVLKAHTEDATTKGASLLCGGKRMKRPGFYFEPTVLTNVNHTMLVMREESFGPIIGIQKVTSDEEAIKLMNDTPYGLTAGVYTANRERAQAILGKVHAGSAYWNCCDRVSPRLPWTGRKHSGIGSTLSTLGILAFLQPKAWHLKSG